MANEHIKSLNEAEARIAELKRQMSACETQIKELQSRSSFFKYSFHKTTPNHHLR